MITIFGLLAYFIVSKAITERKQVKQLHILPPFKAVKINGDSNIVKITKFDKTIIMNYFNTHCNFCKHEIKDFISHLHLFSEIQIFLISNQPIDTLHRFQNKLFLDTISQINIYKCKYLDFSEKFGDVVPPTTFIYDSNKRLIRKYKGQIRASVVANEINKYYKKNN